MRARGEITLLIGPNGAGKSTVLKTLFGLLTPRSGEVRFEGKSINGKSQRELLADGIAFVPQGRNLFGSLSVKHNLELGGITLPRGRASGARIEERCKRFPRIRERINNQHRRCPAASRKQLEISRALLLRPRVLLIDEPSIGLSPKLVQEVMTLLRELADSGVTVLMVEQNVAYRLKYANRALVLEMGRLALDRPASEAAPRSGPEPVVPGRACGEVRGLKAACRAESSADDTLSIAVAGAGAIGRRHLELVDASTECALTAIVDPAPAAVEIARQAGVRLYRTLPELFAQERPDGVIIATPNALHVENALDCIKAGVAALVEKPVALTVEEGLRLLHAADRASAKLLVGHHRAHSPILAKAREIVRSGMLGSLVAATAARCSTSPTPTSTRRRGGGSPGGGPILINMIHEIGNLRSLCGEIVAVCRRSRSNATRGHAVEDTVAINLRFESGHWDVPALRYRGLCPQLGADVAGEQELRDVSGRRLLRDRGHRRAHSPSRTMRLKVYDRKEDRSWWKAVAHGRGGGRPLRSARAPARALLRRHPRRGAATGHGARWPAESADHRGHCPRGHALARSFPTAIQQ